MVDQKAISRQQRDTIKESIHYNNTADNKALLYLLDSHEVADAEISRLTDENAALTEQAGNCRCGGVVND